MSTRRGFSPRGGRYGIDAPILIPVPVFLIIGGIAWGVLSQQPWPLIGAAIVFLCTACWLHATLRGKFVVWSRLLDAEHLTGDERALDLGCGRGAVLLEVARRLSTGVAVGVDSWTRADQSGNSPDATRRNGVTEGVADRIEINTADVTSLPFHDGEFDLVTASLSLHNVKPRVARERAIDEAVRVLRPGGRLLIADIAATHTYRQRLIALGVTELHHHDAGWRMWFCGPFLRTNILTAAMSQTIRSPTDIRAE